MRFSKLVENAEQASAYLSALANAKRIHILSILVEGEQSVGALASLVGLSQSALSQHLAKMRAISLVETRRDGQTIYYSLACDLTPQLFDLLMGSTVPSEMA